VIEFAAAPKREAKRMKKTLWKDAMPLRRPNPTWQVRNAARFFEKLLRISPGSIVFMRPDGQPAKPTDTLRSLRTEAKAD
jgi:hypothetical protein